MFGMKLKSWMEAHLGRPKTSKTANTATSKKVSKEVSPAPTPSSSASSNSELHVGISGAASVSSGTSQGTVNAVQASSPEYLDDRRGSLLKGSEGHNNRDQVVRIGTVEEEGSNCSSRAPQSNNNSGGILLGGAGGFSTTNNLSSPDTGYSTDGYSPKSVYPALSFESSGKSTPKSSYTISSLVSSELLHTSSTSSSSHKVPTTTSLSSGSVSIHVHLDGLERKMVEVVEKRRSSPGRQEDLIEAPASTSIKDVHVYSSSKKRSDDNDSVKPSPSLNEPPSSFQYCGGPKGLETTNPFREMPSTKSASSFPPPSGTGVSGTSSNHHLSNGESSGEPDSSSKVPKLRTSLGSSQITSESKPSPLLPVYSISSPRKERTKIKTNPWLPIFPHSTVQCVSHVNSKPVSLAGVVGGDEGDSPPVKSRVGCVEGENSKEEEERLLRVSTSGGSDSGKGSLGTNRNSTESSVLLTDSPRNSIISHETPPDSDDTNTPSPHQQSRPGAHSRWTSSSPSPGHPAPVSSSTKANSKKVLEEDEVKRIVTMVDKETDILSDWAPSDEDEEEEDEEEEGEETEGPTTPTPSTPTDSRLPGGRSSSSDIDFGDSSASAVTGISSLPPRSGQPVDVFFHPQPIQVFPKMIPPGGGGECSFFPIQTIHPRSPSHLPPFAGLVYSDPSIDSDYLNANILGESVKSPPSSSSSTALARGALGFLRKIFKKTSSCSSQRTSSPGSERVRRFRKGRGEKDGIDEEDFVPMRSPLLTAESLLSPHPLVGRRAPLHPHHTFLTPTPNAFRRRSGGGGSGESGESKGSSSGKSGGKNKQVKTDIIRLPGGASHLLSPSSKGHRGHNNTSSCSTTSSSENKSGGGVFCVSALLENPYEGGGGGGGGGAGGGNSSGSSSLHSMSTSVSAASANLNNCRNSSHPGGFLPETFLHPRDPKGPSTHAHHVPQGLRDFAPSTGGDLRPHPPPVGMSHPYSPSFNNYSPIHRLVVTGSNSSHFHPSESPLPPPRTVTTSSFHPPPPPQVMSTFTPTPHNRPLPPHHLPPPTFSPLANHRPPGHPPHPPEGFLVSPSPILGNPRYQYIASSNQNSPILNVPKRQGAPNYPTSFSPVPPPRSNPRTPNPFITPTSSPNPQQHFSNVRRGSVGVADVIPQQQQNNLNANLLPAGRMNVLSRSHSYQQQQQQQQHYYASPNHQRPPLPPQQQPLLMRTHLHNQNIRLNNFLMNKQRSKVVVRPRNSQSFHERIYESVDSEDEGEEMVSGDEGGEEYDEEEADCRRRLVEPPPPPRKRPPVPMALFGPNTFLSETETRLLQADREADRKYKRLINEAEALLREISAVKSQQIHQHHHQPWVSRSHQDDRFQMEECPQSDPLRRKAYDCWALRRLQQELAGCCASPPVLHRSRMNLQSPSTPTGNNGGQPYPVGLSLISHAESSAPRANNFMDNRTSGHF